MRMSWSTLDGMRVWLAVRHIGTTTVLMLGWLLRDADLQRK
jgi:hypothetical protein